jgi:hypothetical protein
VQQHLAGKHPPEALAQAAREGQWDGVSAVLLSFDRTAKVKPVELMHLNLVVELALTHGRLFAAYLAMYHSIRTDTHTFPNPMLSQQWFMAVSKGDATLFETIFDMGLYKCAPSIYQALSIARAVKHDVLQQHLLSKLSQDNMRIRYGVV